jgi:Mrp family chromosome partitioning ATPase
MADGQLAVVAAGDAPMDPYRLLQTDRFRDFVLGVKQQFHHVVLDIPPILPVPDWRLIAAVTDGFLIVVGAHHTPRRMLEETLSAMDPADVIGIVFNAADRMDARYAAYYAKAYRAGSKRAAPAPGV